MNAKVFLLISSTFYNGYKFDKNFRYQLNFTLCITERMSNIQLQVKNIKVTRKNRVGIYSDPEEYENFKYIEMVTKYLILEKLENSKL